MFGALITLVAAANVARVLALVALIDTAGGTVRHWVLRLNAAARTSQRFHLSKILGKYRIAR
jgi:hypothetical protein